MTVSPIISTNRKETTKARKKLNTYHLHTGTTQEKTRAGPGMLVQLCTGAAVCLSISSRLRACCKRLAVDGNWPALAFSHSLGENQRAIWSLVGERSPPPPSLFRPPLPMWGPLSSATSRSKFQQNVGLKHNKYHIMDGGKYWVKKMFIQHNYKTGFKIVNRNMSLDSMHFKENQEKLWLVALINSKTVEYFFFKNIFF